MRSTVAVRRSGGPRERLSGVIESLNGRYHRIALWVFLGITLAHWAEHLAQAVQVYVLGWARPDSRGVLGLAFPWLVSSEWLHYFYAIVMLVGLLLLRRGLTGRARTWWTVALAIQFWHHVEHALLLGQAIAGSNLFGEPVPTSIAQLLIMRVELHLLYNGLVFVPMVVAMVLHMWPSEAERARVSCTCAVHSRRREPQLATVAQ